MQSTNVSKEVCKLSTIPKKVILKLSEYATLSIVESILESKEKNINDLEFDIGIGNLIIHYDNDSIKFKFKPSDYLASQIKYALDSKNKEELVDLKNILYQNIIDKLTNTYKELL